MRSLRTAALAAATIILLPAAAAAEDSCPRITLAPPAGLCEFAKH